MFKEYCRTCLPSNHTIFCTFHGEERFKLFKIYYVVIILISLREQCYLHLWWYFYHCGCFDIQCCCCHLYQFQNWCFIIEENISQFTFDDRVDAYRRNIARALKKTEKREVMLILCMDIMTHIMHDCMGVLLRMIIKIYMFIMKILIKWGKLFQYWQSISYKYVG